MTQETSPAEGRGGLVSWLTWPGRLVTFGCWMAWQVLKANVRVVGGATRRGGQPPPTVVGVRTDGCSDGEVAVLSILISLTPGTLVLAVDRAPGATTLFVHTTVDDRPTLLASVTAIERRLLHAVRRDGRRSGAEPDPEEAS